MLTLQQDVVRHMKVTARAAGMPTAHCPLIGKLHSPTPQWCRHAEHFMITSCPQCACVWLHSVAATAMSDVVNLTLQIRASAVGGPLPFHLRCVQLPPMHRCQMSDINIGLTLMFHHHHHHRNFYSGLSSNAATRTTIDRVSTSSIRQCCNSSGISMSSDGAERLTGTERK